jgi:hypothetical protein
MNTPKHQLDNGIIYICLRDIVIFNVNRNRGMLNLTWEECQERHEGL